MKDFYLVTYRIEADSKPTEDDLQDIFENGLEQTATEYEIVFREVIEVKVDA